MTRKELREYGCGRQETQEDGSVATVFFKPGFLASSEDLWGRWLAPKRKGKEDDTEGDRNSGVVSGYAKREGVVTGE